jgi:hypothetical protein
LARAAQPETVEVERLAKIERRLPTSSQWAIYGGVALLTIFSRMLSWFHLINVAVANGYVAPGPLLFSFPAIVDGFMGFGSRHADESHPARSPCHGSHSRSSRQASAERSQSQERGILGVDRACIATHDASHHGQG